MEVAEQLWGSGRGTGDGERGRQPGIIPPCALLHGKRANWGGQLGGH